MMSYTAELLITENLFAISLAVSAVILLLFLFSPLLDRRYSAGFKYFAWLILAARLLIPLRTELPHAPVRLPAPADGTVVLAPQEGSEGALGFEFYYGDSYIAKGDDSASSAAYAPIITTRHLLFIIWEIGFFALLLWRFGGYFVFRMRIRGQLQPDGKGVFRCGGITSPMLVGFFRPVILLPDREYSEDERDIIIRHEEVHKRRLDLWYKLLLTLAAAMHWFNPLVHLMARRANRDLEYSCDDIVIRGMDTGEKQAYALTILKSMKEEK